MMKKTIYFICIMTLIMGCAASFKHKRALSKPMVSLALGKIQEGNIPGALVELRRALDANSGDPEVYMGFAMAYRQSGAYDKALENVDKAIKYSGNLGLDHPGMKSEAYFMKGTILALQSGKEEEAIKNFQLATRDELYATPEFAYNNISAIYYGLKRYPEAQDAAQEALNRNPQYAPAWRTLSLVYLQEGKEDQAIEALDNAIKQYSGYTEAHWDLAQILIRKGRTKEGIAHLNEVVQLDPGGPFGTKAQEQLGELGAD
jgi:tetratricopeptide (TPR) repeat protein